MIEICLGGCKTSAQLMNPPPLPLTPPHHHPFKLWGKIHMTSHSMVSKPTDFLKEHNVWNEKMLFSGLQELCGF